MEPSPPPKRLSILFLACVAALGGFLFGYDSGCINGAVGSLEKAFGITGIGSGFNVASMLLGCAAGAFFGGRIADRFGRRAALLTSAIFFGISAWGSGIAENSNEFIIYRLVGGFAVGAASVISPAYISEIAPARNRGALATLQQLAIVLGLFFAFLVNWWIANCAGGTSAPWVWGLVAWRWMFWAELIPIGTFLGALFFIPESPRFLVAAGRVGQAQAVLAGMMSPAEANVMIQEIERTMKKDHRPTFADLVDSNCKRVYPIVWVGLAIAALQQLVGINVVFYYGEVLWRAAGFSEAQALLINVISGSINIGSTIVALLLVDRVGRRPLLIFGAIGMAVFLGLLAFVFSGAQPGNDGNLVLSPHQGMAALVAANLYIVCFGVTWGPVVWVLLGEMFPNQFRGAALSLAGLSMWLANFLVTMTFPTFLQGIGLGGAYGIYAAFAIGEAAFALLAVRETKGKTLEQME